MIRYAWRFHSVGSNIVKYVTWTLTKTQVGLWRTVKWNRTLIFHSYFAAALDSLTQVFSRMTKHSKGYSFCPWYNTWEERILNIYLAFEIRRKCRIAEIRNYSKSRIASNRIQIGKDIWIIAQNVDPNGPFLWNGQLVFPGELCVDPHIVGILIYSLWIWAQAFNKKNRVENFRVSAFVVCVVIVG